MSVFGIEFLFVCVYLDLQKRLSGRSDYEFHSMVYCPNLFTAFCRGVADCLTCLDFMTEILVWIPRNCLPLGKMDTEGFLANAFDDELRRSNRSEDLDFRNRCSEWLYDVAGGRDSVFASGVSRKVSRHYRLLSLEGDIQYFLCAVLQVVTSVGKKWLLSW